MGVSHTDQSNIQTHYSNPCHDGHDDATDASITHPFITRDHDQIKDHDSSIKEEINGLIRTDDPANIFIASQVTRDYLSNNDDSSRLATSNDAVSRDYLSNNDDSSRLATPNDAIRAVTSDGILLNHSADQIALLDNGTENNPRIDCSSTDLSLWSSAADYQNSPLEQEHELMARSIVSYE